VGTHVLNLNSWATWTPSNLTQKPKSLSRSHPACLSSVPSVYHARACRYLCRRQPAATCPPPAPRRHLAPPRRPTARLGRVVPRGARHQAPLRRAPRPAAEEPLSRRAQVPGSREICGVFLGGTGQELGVPWLAFDSVRLSRPLLPCFNS
jgi:hypothetical protein